MGSFKDVNGKDYIIRYITKEIAGIEKNWQFTRL